MAKHQRSNRNATQPIVRVVDNSDAMAIEQLAREQSHKPIKHSDMPAGQGTFAPYGNTNFQ